MKPSMCWVEERSDEPDVCLYPVQQIHYQIQSSYQEILIVSSPSLGKSLFLDGRLQICELDDFIYHECLVHPAAILQRKPREVLILGGGDGAALREILKWNSVERVVMVDIDHYVIDACKEFLPEIHLGSFEDERLNLVLMDATAFLSSARRKSYDLIISDLTEYLEGGPAEQLYRPPALEQIQRAIKPGGALGMQVGAIGPLPHQHRHFREVVSSLGQLFPHVLPYSSSLLTHTAPWGFVAASLAPHLPPLDRPSTDHLLASATVGPLRMIDGITMEGILRLPLYVRRLLA